MKLFLGALSLLLSMNAWALKLNYPIVVPGHEDQDWSVLVTVTDTVWHSVNGGLETATTVELLPCVVDCGAPPPVQPTQGYIKLDGRFYSYNGTMGIYDSVLLYGSGSSTPMSNCRRANGSALPSSSVLMYLPGFQVVALATDATWRMYRIGSPTGGNVIELRSSSGDAVCVGETSGPTNDQIFGDGFDG
jgi:hypothetical protein